MADATLAVASAPIVTSAAPVAIRNLAPGEEGRWDAFVASCPEATFFHLAGWRRVIETAFQHRTFYLMAERDGAVTGVLPLTLVKTRLFGTRLIANAFCVRGGPIAADAASLEALDAAAVTLMEELRAPVLEFRSASDHRSGWITKGDLYASFRKRFAAAIDPQVFFAAKSQEMRHRHQKFENTPYALEPNCKESPGGLRDLQVILWVAKAAGFRVARPLRWIGKREQLDLGAVR